MHAVATLPVAVFAAIVLTGAVSHSSATDGVVTRVPLVVPADSPVSVRLTLDRQRYAPGSTGQVQITIGRSGYLLVLYADPYGHVRVAFPLDPTDPSTVSRDTVIHIRSRGDRDAFIVDDSTGGGTWYAAISTHPFEIDSISTAGHWDYRTIPRVREPANAEQELTAFVERIQLNRFEYDIVSFTIGTDTADRSAFADPWPSGPVPPEPTGPWWGPGWGGPFAPGPWWISPHWPGPFYDHVVEGVGGAYPGGAGGGPSPVSAARAHAPARGSGGSGGPSPADHPPRGHY